MVRKIVVQDIANRRPTKATVIKVETARKNYQTIQIKLTASLNFKKTIYL